MEPNDLIRSIHIDQFQHVDDVFQELEAEGLFEVVDLSSLHSIQKEVLAVGNHFCDAVLQPSVVSNMSGVVSM